MSSVEVVPGQVVVPDKGTSIAKFSKGSNVTFPKKDIGPQFSNKVIAWFEQFYFKFRRYPEDDEIMGFFKFTAEEVFRLNNSKYWLNCLRARGITLPVATGEAGLNATQVAAISLLTNFSDTRSPESKMAAIKVTPEQLNGWYQNPEFQRELQLRTEVSLENSHPEVQAHLMRQVQQGNMRAIEFYYNVTGRVKTPEQLNVQLAVTHLITVVQTHVKDPETQRAIATGIQELRDRGIL